MSSNRSSRLRYLLPKLARTILRRFSFNPSYGIELGKNATLHPPRQINGASFIRVGDKTTIREGVRLSAYDFYAGEHFFPSLVIGNHVFIGYGVCMACISRVSVGDFCVLSEFVYISDHVHGHDPKSGAVGKQKLISKGGVHIGEYTFVGYRACILPGVTLGRHCVVGANAVVTHSFPDFSMVAGVPARLIKTYSFEKQAWIPVKKTDQS